MRAIGIIRRVDDLGRVLIPKEIRRTLHIKENDPLEIFTDRDGSVIFKPYLPYVEPWRLLEDVADEVCANEDFREFEDAILELAKKMKEKNAR